MDFQNKLLRVGEALKNDEVKALAFLCTDLVDKDLGSLESSSDLFTLLADKDILSPEQPFLLVDLLRAIQRPRLIRELNLHDQGSTTRSLIPPFRKLLYDLSEDITEEDLKKIKFLLKDQLPRKKLEENVTTLEVFRAMEHKDLLNIHSLTLLENIMEKVCPAVRKKINKYKENAVKEYNRDPPPHAVTWSCPIVEETKEDYVRPRSLSAIPSVQDLFPPRPARPSSCGPQDLSTFDVGDSHIPPSYVCAPQHPSAENSMQRSYTSLDTKISDVNGAFHGLSLLTTRPANSAVPNDKIQVVSSLFPGDRTLTTVTGQPEPQEQELLQTYGMEETKKRVCLIINNHNFSSSVKQLNNRDGTHVDESSLGRVFGWLGFDVQIKKDCTSDQMLSLVKELSRDVDSEMDCLVCCVLSHGLIGAVYGVDGQVVQVKDLTEPFNALYCPALVEKPKLFFIQACQGIKEQQPVEIQADNSVPSKLCTDAHIPEDTIPSDADFLLGMATVPHYASFRDRKLGTWYIQSLCQNLVQMVPRRYDLLSILTKVNDDVSKKTDSRGVKKQMPQPALTLRKKVVFPVPKDPPPSLT